MQKSSVFSALTALAAVLSLFVAFNPNATAATSSMPGFLASGSSFLGLTAPVVTADTDTSPDCTDQTDLAASDRPICSNSNAWRFLNYAHTIGPGTRILRATAGGNGQSTSCSIGWIGKYQLGSTTYDPVIYTAGHCGGVGSKWYYLKAKDNDPTGQRYDQVYLGQTVMNYSCTYAPESSNCTSSGNMLDYDLSVIQIDPAFAQAHANDGTIQPALTRAEMDNIVNPIKAINGWDFTGYDLSNLEWGAPMSYDEINEENPLICRLGWKTGMSCGVKSSTVSGTSTLTQFLMSFTTTASTGDSGGTVFAVTKTGLRPVGIHTSSWKSNDSSTQYATAALLLEPILSGAVTGMSLYTAN
ncbi:MAG: hypothetical protein Q3972_07985 [Corynebacterium sp.]|nr:hypothetical protein [Corynebacterium sp.]